MMQLSGKKAVVTGASRGIGKAIALAFAKEGADVVISYLSKEEEAKDTIKKIEELSRSGKAIRADFLNIHEVTDFFRKALDFLKSIDILVNNAALYSTTDFLKLNTEEFEQLLKMNVIVPMLLSQLTAKHMTEKKTAGKIINISSISGNRPYSSRTAFATSKAALNMLTQSMALDLAQYRIRVNAIAPGPTPYDTFDETAAVNKIPLQRFGKVEDYASAALYLASEESSWMTGQIMTIDGGSSLSF